MQSSERLNVWVIDDWTTDNRATQDWSFGRRAIDRLLRLRAMESRNGRNAIIETR
jgi:hypothetical protein